MSRAAWAAVVLLGLMAILAMQGGEYSTGDYFELKRRVAAAESAEVKTRIEKRLKEAEEAARKSAK